jgi:outer membrane protein TolC
LAVLGVLWGCAVGPNYRQPKIPVESGWSEAAANKNTSPSQTGLDQWWLVFKDPELSSLVERAIKANLDLQLAEARIHEARATTRIEAAPLWPEFDATSSFSRTLQSQNSAQIGSTSLSAVSVISNQPMNLYQQGFDASWEIDVFGGTRRSVESAQDSFEASIYDRNDVLLTLLGEVASGYIDLRSYQTQL